MATQKPEMSEPSDRTQPIETPDGQHESASVVPTAEAEIQIQSMTSDLATDQLPDASDLGSQIQEATFTNTDQDTRMDNTSSAPETDKSQVEHGVVMSPTSKLFTPLGETNVVSPPGFTFSKLDRRNLELGGKRKDFQQVTRDDFSSPAKGSSAPEDAQDTNPAAVSKTSPSGATGNIDNSPKRLAQATPHGSDVVTDVYSEPVLSQSIESVQCQLDQKIYQEASMSDGFERTSSPAPQSEDVIYMGVNRPRYPSRPLSGPTVDEARPQVPRRLPYLPQEVNNRSASASLHSRVNGSFSPAAPVQTRRPSSGITKHHPVPRPRSQARGNVNMSAPSQSGIQELLEVVEYKFKQNEQQLRQTFLTDSNNVQRELEQAYGENEELHLRITALEDRCKSSEATIVKYKTQIGKAKGLQKFLDGLGSDLHSLKRSYDAERIVFAERIEANETEISRLESTLAGKNEFENMLSHSKASLERLLEARNFELQSLVQHRDMLRTQLDERIGQLVEERDARLKVEQLVAELRDNERTSLTNSIEHCAASIVSKFGEFHRQDDQLAVGIAQLQHTLETLAERASVTPDDCEAIKSEIQALGLHIAQSLSVESASNTAVAEVSSAMEGIVQTHVQTLCRSLDRLESASAQAASDASAQIALRVELQGMADRLKNAESQLESANQSKASLEKSLNNSIARVAELEIASTIAADTDADQITSQDVENKVILPRGTVSSYKALTRTQINEAVADARKQLSISANVLIAQEKSRYSNELKKIENEHRKAQEKSQLQNEEISKLHSQLEEMQTSMKASADRSSAQQLDALVDRFRALEKKHHAVQLELDDKRSLEPRLAALRAERDTAQTAISTCETKITELTQDIDRRNTDLLQARGSEERTRVQLEDLRKQNQSEVDGVRRELSQAEEKTKYAEAGLVQMKSSAERAIREEQERHRKQQEALEQRLVEAQSELQMKSEEADDHRAFVERTVTQQQAVWQRLNADLETKASDVKAQLEETSELLRNAQEERDTLQSNTASLQAEMQQYRKSEAGYRSREDTSRAAMDDVRHQLDAAQTEIASLQAVQQRYLREKDERSSREIRAKSAYDTLHEEHEAAKAVIADLRASEKQSKEREIEREQREADKQKELVDVRSERDIAQAILKELQTKRDEVQIPRSVDVDGSHWVAPQPEFVEGYHVDNLLPPPKSERSTVSKQRKRADRNTNTIVESGVTYGHAETQLTRPEGLQTRAQVVLPAKPALNMTTTFPGNDEMLDSVSSQQERVTQTQFSNYQGSKKSALPGHTGISQTFSTSLDFSGKPMLATREQVTERAHTLGRSQSNSGSEFKVYEDSQSPLNEGIDEESSVRANFTFRKPYPLPNSGSKRLKRTASDKSLGGRSASSRGTRRTPENTGELPQKQANKTPEASEYPYGSSPEFMNPPSTMTKRRYSGGPPTPGNLEPLTSRRPSTPLVDPRIAKKTSGNKRASAKDAHPENDLEPPAKKKRAMQSVTGSESRPPSDDSFLARSSQSVNDLPRMEDLNAGRGGNQIRSSHMRTSGSSRRVTRNQKASKGQYHDSACT